VDVGTDRYVGLPAALTRRGRCQSVRDCGVERWTRVDTGSTARLAAITWAHGQFVAVGQHDIVASPDGLTWTQRTSNAAQNEAINAITWGGNQFVAAGSSHEIFGGVGPTPIFTSPDGVTWTHGVIADLPGPAIEGIASNGSRYVAVGDVPTAGDRRAIAVSDDGVTWTYDVLPDAPTMSGLYAVVWTGHRFVTVGGAGVELSSPDGLVWTPDFMATSRYFSALATNGEQCVAVGFSGLIMTDASCGRGDLIQRDGFDGQ
jgi:hypothetical protein